MNSETETFAFSADINQLLALIINAVYTNKEVFLRELISNASDALNKIRYQSLIDTTCLDNDPNLEIKISFDRSKNTLIIRDTGIGMTKDELINNLGTIANSGTKTFIESLTTNKDTQFIGQFGVGFYSAYLVANKVVCITKNNNDLQYSWDSEGNGIFNVQQDNTDYQLIRGTIMILYLKEDMKEYLEESTIKNLIKKHNQFIDFPIYLETKKNREIVIDDDDGVLECKENDNTDQENDNTDQENNNTEQQNNTEQENNTDPENNTNPENNIEEKKPKTEIETYYEYDEINKDKPLWTLNPKDVVDDKYVEFYKYLTNDYDTYLDVSHFNIEGQIEFKGILYIPKHSPIDLFDGQTSRKGMIKVYSRKVFITDNCDELIPEYLKFLRGVIETDDIPLNISRETLQNNKILKVIGKNIIKKTFELINKISLDVDKFRIFYEQYNKSIKLGIHEDNTNRIKLTPLLRYETSKSNGDIISLDDYIANMIEGQTSIYYIISESVKTIINSPFLEIFKVKNLEVIYMYDPLDEYITQQVKDYKDKKLVCITKENIDLGLNDSEKQDFEKLKDEYKPVCDFIKSTLADNVEKVIISNKLSNSPCVLSTSEFGWTANMQRILKAQTFNKQEMDYMLGKKILEINPSNSIIKKIKNSIDNNNINQKLQDIVQLLYDLALQTSGFTLENPVEFSNKILSFIDNEM